MTFAVDRLMRLWDEPPPDRVAAEAAFRKMYADPVSVNGAPLTVSELVDIARSLSGVYEGAQREILDVVEADGRVAVAFRLAAGSWPTVDPVGNRDADRPDRGDAGDRHSHDQRRPHQRRVGWSPTTSVSCGNWRRSCLSNPANGRGGGTARGGCGAGGGPWGAAGRRSRVTVGDRQVASLAGQQLLGNLLIAWG